VRRKELSTKKRIPTDRRGTERERHGKKTERDQGGREERGIEIRD